MNWLREAISDENKLADMAYISVGALMVSVICSLVFLCTMSVVDYLHCNPIVTVSTGAQDTRNVIPCRFDPLPLGQSLALVFGAFGALLGALAGYMAATRRTKKDT